MLNIRASALCLLARIALAQSYNLANGAHVTASSTYNSGPCSLYACGPHQVVNNIPNSIVDVGQWISNPGECDSDWRTSETSDISPVGRHNETLTIDWSANYGTQLISEVRFRYGSMAANPWGVQLIMYSQLPMNTAPIAVPIADASDWYAFTFLEPVTASGISLTWYGMQSRDNGKTCFVSIGNVEAWTGIPPNPIPIDAPSGNGRTISIGAIVSMIIFPILGILICLCLGVLLVRKRRQNLAQRFATTNGLGTLHEISLRRRQQRNEERQQKLVDEEDEPELTEAAIDVHVDAESVGVWNTAK